MESREFKLKDDSKSKTRYVLDPFQIYCYEKRPEVQELYPLLKTSEVTSFIAEQWRKLPENMKQKYRYLALVLKNNQKRIKNIVADVIDGGFDEFPMESKESTIPNLWIIERGSLNGIVSTISYEIGRTFNSA